MYSQNKEEEIIQKYFGNHKGTFLDIGANDGITFSNSLALIDKGWRGVLVEPSPKAFRKLQRLHKANPNVVEMNVALTKKTGMVELHESGSLLRQGDVALVSTLVEEELKRWESLKIPFHTVSVPGVTIYEITGYARDFYIDTFEFISIDVEGMELDVLPQFDFTKLGTKMICVEWNSKNLERYNEIIKPYGFTLHHKNAENLIYVL